MIQYLARILHPHRKTDQCRLYHRPGFCNLIIDYQERENGTLRLLTSKVKVYELTIKSSESPTIESPSQRASSLLSAPLTAITRSSCQSLTLWESRQWHQRLSHVYPKAIESPVMRYTNDNLICTVCIQVIFNQTFINVPVKCTTQSVELVLSEVSGTISTLNFGHNRYYIQFISHYMGYTSIWLLPTLNSKMCTSTYRSFQVPVD